MENGHLLLTRKIGETIIIGDYIKITPKQINGKLIQISITAPKNISVHREEIYNKLKEQGENLIKENELDKQISIIYSKIESIRQEINDNANK